MDWGEPTSLGKYDFPDFPSSPQSLQGPDWRQADNAHCALMRKDDRENFKKTPVEAQAQWQSDAKRQEFCFTPRIQAFPEFRKLRCVIQV